MPLYPGYPWMQWPGMYMPRPPFIPAPCRSHAVEISKEEARKDRRERRDKKVKRKDRRHSKAKRSRKRRKASGSGSSSSISSSTSGSAQRPKKVAHTEQKASKLRSAKEPPGSKLQEPKLPRLKNPEKWTCSKCDEQNKWERSRCNNCYASRPSPPNAQHCGLESPDDEQEVGCVAHATVLATGLSAVGVPFSGSDVALDANRTLVTSTCDDDDEEGDEEEEAYQQAVIAAFDRSMIASHKKTLPKEGSRTSPRVNLQVGRSNASSPQKANACKEQGSTPASMSREQPPASASGVFIENYETSQLAQESLGSLLALFGIQTWHLE